MLADPLRLSRVLNHLLSNAVKSTAAGSVTLRVVQGAPGRWTFSVRDTGVGLTLQQRAQLAGLQPGDEAADAAHPGGPALGLHAVRRLV